MSDIQVAFPEPCSEQWEAMAPDGCARFCQQCDTTVHDLENFTASEVAALLRAPGSICVRARIDRRGEIQLRPGRSGARLIAVIGAGLSLIATSPTSLAKTAKPRGEIVGTVADGDTSVTVSAQAENGKIYRTKVRRDGKFRFKHLPPGTYELSYLGGCAGQWPGDKVVVEPGQAATTNTTNGTDDCVIIGVMRLRDDDG